TAEMSLKVKSVAAGELTNCAEVLLDGQIVDRSCSTTKIGGGAPPAGGAGAGGAGGGANPAEPVAVTVEGPTGFAVVGSKVRYLMTVANNRGAPLQGVQATLQLPTELMPEEGTAGAVYGDGRVMWNLGDLPAGGRRTLEVVTYAAVASKSACVKGIVQTADGGRRDSPESCIELRGVAALLTEVVDRLDPLPIGGETTYAVRVTNQGTQPLTDLVLECEVPPGMEFVAAEGAVGHDVKGRKVIFQPFNGPDGRGMAPKKQLDFQVQLRGATAGDQRFRASVKVAELPTPIVKEESTRVYDPKTGANRSPLNLWPAIERLFVTVAAEEPPLEVKKPIENAPKAPKASKVPPPADDVFSLPPPPAIDQLPPLEDADHPATRHPARLASGR
ncbi:MAG: hypothetical protein ACRDD1_00540, partial [Planctomycetia bacterium]